MTSYRYLPSPRQLMTLSLFMLVVNLAALVAVLLMLLAGHATP
jgi:hypothetical protein